MRIAMLAGSLLVAVAAPAWAQLPPAPRAGQGNGRAAMGPNMMEHGPMVPGLPGQQGAGVDAGPAGTGMGPQVYGGDPDEQDQMAPDAMNGPGNGRGAQRGLLGPTRMNGGAGRQ